MTSPGTAGSAAPTARTSGLNRPIGNQMPGKTRASRCGSFTTTAAPLAARCGAIAQLLLPTLGPGQGSPAAAA